MCIAAHKITHGTTGNKSKVLECAQGLTTQAKWNVNEECNGKKNKKKWRRQSSRHRARLAQKT